MCVCVIVNILAIGVCVCGLACMCYRMLSFGECVCVIVSDCYWCACFMFTVGYAICVFACVCIRVHTCVPLCFPGYESYLLVVFSRQWCIQML